MNRIIKILTRLAGAFVVLMAIAGQTVAGPTSTSLAATPNPVLPGQVVTLAAVVTGTNPTGQVEFRRNGTSMARVTLSAGKASYAWPAVEGTWSMTAAYLGNAGNTASTSQVVGVAVMRRPTTTEVGSSPNPVQYSQTVQVTARVAGTGSLSGNVTFKDGGQVIGTAALALSGTAYTARINSTFAVGTHNLTAEYAGDSVNAPSVSAVSVHYSNGNPTQTALAVSPTLANSGQPITLTANVTGSSPQGTVVFRDGSIEIGRATLANGVASLTTSALSVGSHNLLAEYLGGGTNSASSSIAAAVTVRATTSTSLAVTPSPSVAGQPVTFTATISTTAGASGTVAFKDNGQIVGTAPVVNNTATSKVILYAAGARTMIAEYSGDATRGSSSSSPVILTVNDAPPAALPPVAFSPDPVTTFSHDAENLLISKTIGPGPEFVQDRYSYDPRRNVQTQFELSGAGTFDREGTDRVDQFTDSRSLKTTYTRDGFGNVTTLQSPDTGNTSSTYDRAGNLLSATDSRGAVSTYTYDSLDRPRTSTHTLTGKPTLTYTWNYDETGPGFSNGVGRLTSSTFPAGSSQVAYDARGRVLNVTQKINPAAGANSASLSHLVSYTYASSGQPDSMTYPSGRKVTFAYSQGALSALSIAKDATTASQPIVSGITYTPLGQVRSWYWKLAGGDQLHERVFDKSMRMVRYRLGEVVRDLSYDEHDRLVSFTHLNAVSAIKAPSYDQSFTYGSDQPDYRRLASVIGGATSWAYKYDAGGNRVAATLNGSTSNYTVSVSSNRLESVSNPLSTYSYDATGNTLSDTAKGLVAGYGANGRLVSASVAGVTHTYDHDAFGRRIRKYSSSGASSTVVFVYGLGGELLGEYSSNGTAIREYVWIGSMPLAVVTPDPANSTNPPLVFPIHADHLDSPRVVTDRSGRIRWRWMAFPFGSDAPETNPSGLGSFSMSLRHPGQIADPETGLYYNMFRDYDPALGRYVQSDPIGLIGGPNTYSYVGSNPLSYVDPYGLWAFGDPLNQEFVDAAAGFGDTISWGATGLIRSLSRINSVDKCSSGYTVGQAAGVLWGLTWSAATVGRYASNVTEVTFFADPRQYPTVQKIWSRSVGGYKGSYELHHWYKPLSAGGTSAGWNLVAVSPWLNRAMSDGGLLFSAFRASMIGSYLGAAGTIPSATYNSSQSDCQCKKR